MNLKACILLQCVCAIKLTFERLTIKKYVNNKRIYKELDDTCIALERLEEYREDFEDLEDFEDYGNTTIQWSPNILSKSFRDCKKFI